MTQSVTTQEYSAFDQAFDFFNAELFGGNLPMCMITLQREKKARGYFWQSQYISRADHADAIDEIALNPEGFTDRTDEEILSTLAHEMCHMWQALFGKPSRNGYHNQEWATKMKTVGLMPSDTGKEGGRQTGQRMTHYMIADGAYKKAFQKLAAEGYKLNWQAKTLSDAEITIKKKKRASKTKYTCPLCDLNAWAKPDVNLYCGDCKIALLPQE